MTGALRLQAVALPVPDVAEAERFYRWSFRLEPAGGPEGPEPVLGWGGGEDRVRLLDGTAVPAPEEAVALRMPAMAAGDAIGWCSARGLEVLDARVSPGDREESAALLPGKPIATFEAPEALNLSCFAVRGWGDLRVELVFPLPAELVVTRGLLDRFWWRSGDWSGLETPGLLGVTWGGADLAAGRRFSEKLGIVPLDPGEPGPLRLGDHQIVLEEGGDRRLPALALVMPRASLGEVKRTLVHLGAGVREAGNRLATRDPAGRVVLVLGVQPP